MTNEVATIEPKRQSLIATMAGTYQMEPAVFRDTVRKTCMPNNASNEDFAAFLMVAHQHGLNPVTREIYAFPKKGGGVQPIVGVDGWATLINSHPQADGMTFNDHFGEDGKLSAITCSIYRKDRQHPISVTEYMEECFRPTEPWQKWPARMLRHKAMIQAARYAFGFAGIIDPEEAERSPEVETGEVVAPPPPQDASADAVGDTDSIPHEHPAGEPDPDPDTGSDQFDLEQFLEDLSAALAGAHDEEALEEAWNEFDVESTLDGDDDALQRAFDAKNQCSEAIKAAGNLSAG